MTLSFRHEVLHLGLRDPFLIARTDHGGGHAVTTVVIELRDDRFPDVVGLGEGYPDRYYGETVETMPVVLQLLIDAIGEVEPTAEGLRAASDGIAGAIRWNGAAKCALDSALHDLVGKVTGQPVHRLLGLSTDIPPTDFTLGLDEPAVVAERAKRAGAFPALKIKVGGPADLATLEAVREVYDKPIRVDANTGWTPETARQLLPALVDLGVELIEQPFPAGRLDWLRDLQSGSPLPIVADESCVTMDDLDALVGVTAGVNVKLAKAGGPGSGGADARPGAGARLPDVPRLHGGDLGRDRRLGGGRLAGRLGRPRRQPAPRRRAVHRPRARRRPPLAAHRRARPGGTEADRRC